MGEEAFKRGPTNPRGDEIGSNAAPSESKESLTLQSRRVIAVEVAIVIVISEGTYLGLPGAPALPGVSWLPSQYVALPILLAVASKRAANGDEVGQSAASPVGGTSAKVVDAEGNETQGSAQVVRGNSEKLRLVASLLSSETLQRIVNMMTVVVGAAAVSTGWPLNSAGQQQAVVIGGWARR